MRTAFELAARDPDHALAGELEMGVLEAVRLESGATRMRVPAVEFDDQPQIMSPVRKGTLPWERVYELGDVLLGRAPTRTSAEQVTLFDNNVGMGLQFAACGAKLLELARERGVGREIPTDLFLESTHP